MYCMEKEGKREIKEPGLDVPALAGPTARSSDTYKWQLQIQAVAIAPS